VKLMIPISFFLMASAACTTVWFVSTLKPTSIGAFLFFSVWLISPYVMMITALIYLRSKARIFFHWYVVAIIVSAAGMVFLTDVIFWHPDAQGAIAVFMTPILQGIALAILLPVAWWVSGNGRP
jgi:hypothetical protein